MSTRSERLTVARVGFSEVSNACSVTLYSVMRTGATRLLPQTKTVSGASIGAISIRPDLGQDFVDDQLGARGRDS